MDKDTGFQRACTCIERSNYSEAQQLLEEIILKEPFHFKAYSKLGSIYARQKQYDQAKKYLQEALAINPDYAPALLNLGNVFKENGEEEKAIEYYLLAMHKDDRYDVAYYNLAVAYKQQGDYASYFQYLKEYKRLHREKVKEEKKRDRTGWIENNKDNRVGSSIHDWIRRILRFSQE